MKGREEPRDTVVVMDALGVHSISIESRIALRATPLEVMAGAHLPQGAAREQIEDVLADLQERAKLQAEPNDPRVPR